MILTYNQKGNMVIGIGSGSTVVYVAKYIGSLELKKKKQKKKPIIKLLSFTSIHLSIHSRNYREYQAHGGGRRKT